MQAYRVRDNEAERLRALRSLELCGTAPSDEFQSVVGLARDFCNVPTALITLIDEDLQWHFAKVGFAARSIARDHAFCNQTIYHNRPYVVEDARADGRYAANPFVQAPDGVRFYAGVPIELEPGLPLGSLCVIDRRPRSIGHDQLAQLKQLASVTAALIRQYRDAQAVERLSRLAAEYGRKVAVQSRDIAMRNRMLDDACELGEMGAFEHDMRTGEMRWSQSLKKIHEVDDDDEEIKSSFDFAHLKRFYSKRDRARYIDAVREAVRTRSTIDMETMLRTAKGRKRWVRLKVGLEFEGDEPVRRFGMMHDITREKRLHARLDYLANRDPLTGLHNRNYFLRTADRFLAESTGPICGIAVVDLDGFKSINDSYGHAAGDACLKAVARRLKDAAGPRCLLVRPGGDEFTIVFDHQPNGGDIDSFFETLRDLIQEPIEWKGVTFQVSASIGIATRDVHALPHALELVQEADLAVYKAKAAGRNCIASYSSDLHQTALQRFNVIAQSRQALAERQFVLFYQPKIALADRSLSGFEALLRWRKPDGLHIAPGQFAAALEDPEMSRRLGSYVMEQAVEQARRWRAEGFDFGNIAINLSSSQFVGSSFVDDLLTRVHDAKLDPGDIQVEVTEGVLLSTGASSVASGLKRLSDNGIKIAFDDFGTGYASLIHLRQLEFDIIKLDMSFVQSMLTSAADMAIVQTVLLLAHRLGKTVVAEGVETEMQLDMLRSYGCRFGQGYLFSPPKPPADVVRDWSRSLAKAG